MTNGRGFPGWKKTDSASVLWRKVGVGDKVLLLVHGFGPVPQIQWEELVGKLYGDYTIYIPDLVYFGQSTSDVDVYDPRFLARQVLATFRQNEEKEFYLAGVSYGGLISAIIANENKERVKGLILIDALSKYMDRTYADSLAASLGYDNLGQVLVPEDGKALKSLFKLTFYKPPKLPAFALNKPAKILYSDQFNQKQNLMKYLFANVSAIKSWSFSYGGPVLILWGSDDVLIPVENAELIKEQYEDARLEIIPDAAHAVNMENAEEVAGFIREFTLER